MSSQEKTFSARDFIERKRKRRRIDKSFQEFVDTERAVRIDYGANPGWKTSHLCWEAKGPLAATYACIAPRIRSELNQARKESSCEVAISLFMVGKTTERAKPIIIISSEDKQSRKDARDAITRSKILADTQFELGLMRYPPSGAIRSVAGEDTLMLPPPSSEGTQEIYFNVRESIRLVGMPVYVRHSETSFRQATVNAVHDGSRYGYITAAHTLEKIPHDNAPLDDEDDLEIPFHSDSESGGDDDREFDILSRYSNTSPGTTDSDRSSLSATQALYWRSDHQVAPHPSPEPFAGPLRPRTNQELPPIMSDPMGQLEILGHISSITSSFDCMIISVTNAKTVLSLDRLRGTNKDARSKITVAEPRPTSVIAWTSHGPINGTLTAGPVLTRVPGGNSYEFV